MPTVVHRPVPAELGRENLNDGAPPIINRDFRLEWAVATQSEVQRLIHYIGNNQFVVDPHFAHLAMRCSSRVLHFNLSVVNDRCAMAKIGSAYSFDASFDVERANTVPGFPAHYADLNVERDIFLPLQARTSWLECANNLTTYLQRLREGLVYTSNLFDAHGDSHEPDYRGKLWDFSRALSAAGGNGTISAIQPESVLTLPRRLWDAIADRSNAPIRDLIPSSILSRVDDVLYPTPDFEDSSSDPDEDSDFVDMGDWGNVIPEDPPTPPPPSPTPSEELVDSDPVALPLPEEDSILVDRPRSASPSPSPLQAYHLSATTPLVAAVRFAHATPQQLMTPPLSPIHIIDDDHPEGEQFVPVTLDAQGNLINLSFVQESVKIAYEAGKKEGRTSAIDDLICAAESVAAQGSGSSIDPILIDGDDSQSESHPSEMALDSVPTVPALEIVTHPLLGREGHYQVIRSPSTRRN